MNINDRVRYLRTELLKDDSGKKMTLDAFAARLGVKAPAIHKIERGENSVTDRMIAAICAEYNVNEEWLREGTGEPFRQMSEDDKLAAFFGDALADESTSFRRRFFKMLSMLSVEQWEEMEHLWRMAAELPEEKKD